MARRLGIAVLALLLCSLAGGAEETVLTVTVHGPDGQVVSSGRIDLFPLALRGRSRDFSGSRTLPIATAAIGEDGRGVLRGILAGAWGVAAHSPSGGPGLGELRLVAGMAKAQTLSVTLPVACSLTGRVLRISDAAPLAGVEVAVSRDAGRHDPDLPIHDHYRRSGTDGSWRFDGLAPGLYDVWSRRGGTGWISADAVHVPLVPRFDLLLHDGARLHGIVIDTQSKKPVAGAEVSLMGDDFSARRGALATVETDAEGRYEILTGREFMNAGGMEVSRDGYRTLRVKGTELWNLPENKTIEKDFALVAEDSPGPKEAEPTQAGPAMTVIKGVVRDQEGNPIPVARVTSGEFGTLTGLTGAFLLQVPVGEGSWWLWVRKTGYGDGVLSVQSSEIKKPGGVAVVLPPAPIVRGKVTSATGKTVAGGSVFVAWLYRDKMGYPHADWRTIPRARLGSDGAFAIHLPTLAMIERTKGHPVWSAGNSFAVCAVAPGHGPRISTTFELKKDRLDYSVDLVLPAEEMIEGRVVLQATGRPVPNAPVALTLEHEHLVEWPPPCPPHDGGVVAITGADGRFRIGGLGHLEYSVWVAMPGLAEEWQTFTMPRKEPIELRLRRLSFLAGRVQDPEGKAVAGARIWLEDEEGEDWFGPSHEVGGPTTDREGRFRLRNLPTGSYTLHVYHRDDATGLGPVSHGPVRTGTADLDLTLPIGVEIRGQLLDAKGNPLHMITVWAVPPDGNGPRRYAFTDPDGRFVIPRLAPMAYRVKFVEPCVMLSAVMAGTEVNFQLPGSEKIRGVVGMPEGVYVEGIELKAQLLTGGAVPGVSQNPVTWAVAKDDRHEFEFDFLIPGTYRITGEAETWDGRILRVPTGVEIKSGDQAARIQLELVE